MEAATGLGDAVARRIQHARRDLLDLSARNRLISTPRGSARGRKIEVVDERSDDVFRLLVRERKAMSFLPGAGDEDAEPDETAAAVLAQPDDEPAGNGTPDPRHTDLRLQTRLTSERLQARLLAMYYDAQTYEQEQGVSTLYLAVGFLKWYESPASDTARHAPLLLIPVDLERPSAASRFHLRYREEDVTTNLSLQAKLRAEFGIDLPDVPEMEEIAPADYFQAVSRAIEGQPRWEVLADDMILWFFSFAKYLMYRDLDPANWPAHSPLEGHATLSQLLGDGFVSEPALCGESDRIDPLIPAANMVHVTDADSSQAIVIEEVRRGRHLVVQGPPGTGKSQTITNLIATAVKEGKQVLFVAEKQAALEVVHSRLERLGLGALCLALHSHRANKKAVLEELSRTLALGRPKPPRADGRVELLQRAIERLNLHAESMNTPMVPSDLTPFQIIGRLTALYARGVDASNLGLTGLESWTAARFRELEREVADFEVYLSSIGPPRQHAWRGVRKVEPLLPPALREFLGNRNEAETALTTIAESETALAELLGLPPRDDSRLNDSQQLAQFAIRLVKAPTVDRAAIANPAWDERLPEIARLVDAARALADARYAAQQRALATLGTCLERVRPPSVHPFRGVARTEPLAGDPLRALPTAVSEVIDAVQVIFDVSGRLGALLHVDPRPDASLKEIEQLVSLAERMVKAPRMDRARIADPIWDAHRDQVATVVAQGVAFASARAELKDRIADVAWQTDLATARRHLAGYGHSWFRWFNRDYRAAVAALRGVLLGPPPRALADRLKLVDALLAAQQTIRTLDGDPTVAQAGRDAFGSMWRGSQSDWARLAEIAAWDGECREARLPFDHRAILAAVDEPQACGDSLSVLSARLPSLRERLGALLAPLAFDPGQAFGADAVQSVPVRVLVDRLGQWRERPEALVDWIGYEASRRAVDDAGMGAVGLAIHEGRTTVDGALRDLENRFADDVDSELARGRAEQSAETVTGRLGRDAFGAHWQGILSDWPALGAIVTWDRECRDANLAWSHRQHLARIDSLDDVRNALRPLVAQLNRIPSLLQTLFALLELDLADAFGSNSFARIPIREMVARLGRWRDEYEALSRWIGYRMRQKRLSDAGLGPIVDGLHGGTIPIDAAVDQLQVSYFQALIREVFQRHSGLAEFDGQTHEQWIDQFRALDQTRIEMARGEVAAAHYEAIPRHATGGEMAVVRREIEKKRRHKPIRQLLREAGTAIVGIKPVFMMSPISVAQFLEPGGVTFDLLLIDEASQVSPVDALGAMARAKQVVVVGDDKQLPPTRFFSKMLDEGTSDVENDGDLNAGDLESVLGLCVAQGMSQRMLRWHYRSRHHSLIAVSNREFYENHLYVVPSPTTITARHGLHFRHVRAGVFDRGNTATNRAEAREIADAVIDHARRYPRKSLGVGAFSVAQRDAIRDELEVRQREHVELAEFFSPGSAEPFFVKNLENIQGDERDVIFISVGYARDSTGYLAMNFGPLSNQGGERRLNVLISRARERCEVFSSITADDIDLQRARSRGAAAFKTFLRYAATGVLDTQAQTEAANDSDFERQVDAALTERGYEVHRQVGTAGFLIDLAVVDPVRPGRYLLGIECDGATYHASRSARDRDRLRETVLRDRGWTIYRIWSTDWFHRPDEQTQKLVATIEKALREANIDEEEDDRIVDAPAADTPAPVDAIERIEAHEEASDAPEGAGAWVTAYAEASFEVRQETPIHETSLPTLRRIVVRVVEIEGPIHREELARRITSLWGQQRTGARIAEAIGRAVGSAIAAETLRADADFLSLTAQTTVPVRNRAEVASASLKKPEMIAPAEVRRAIQCLVEEQVGVGRDEIAPLVSRAFGFKSTGAKLKEAIEGTLERMLGEKVLVVRDEKLFLPPGKPET